MKISRSELRERVRKILVGTLLDEGEKVSDKLLDTVIKYYFLKSEMLTDDEKKFLEESYVDLIGRKEREKIKEEIDIERVKKIVSAFSLSKKSSLLEEFPFEKDLRIFDNVEKIYLFYTKETENKFNEYKKNCKFKEKIEGIEIDGREVNETYKKLKELVLKNKVNKDNTVLDMTLGMKTISIAFYRIAVERQIKAINWNEKFLSSYTQINENEFEEDENGPTPRIALSAKLSLMREPIKESLGIYSRINANIKKGNYEVVSDFYKIIGIDDMAFFYKKLDKIFDIESEDESDIFYRKLEKKLEEILKYSNFEEKNKNRIKKVVQYFSKLVIYFEKGNFEKLEWLIKNNEYEIKRPKTEVEENTLKEEIEGFDDRLYFECLKVKYKIIRTKEKLINIVDDLDIKLKDYKDEIESVLEDTIKKLEDILEYKNKIEELKYKINKLEKYKDKMYEEKFNEIYNEVCSIEKLENKEEYKCKIGELKNKICKVRELKKYKNEIFGIDVEELEDRKELLSKVEGIFYQDMINEYIENFEIEKCLEENVDVKIKFFNNKLIIPNLKFKNDLEIDFETDKFWEQKNKEQKKKDREKKKKRITNMQKKTLKKIIRNPETYIHKPILELFEGLDKGEYEVKSERVKEILWEGDPTKELAPQNQKMRALINVINEMIKYKAILKEKEYIEENFIVYSEERNGDYSIKISSSWRI